MRLLDQNSTLYKPVNSYFSTLEYFKMLLKEFYSILTEETAVDLLREHNLLDTVQQADP